MNIKIMMFLVIGLAFLSAALLVMFLNMRRQKRLFQKELNELKYRYDYDMNKIEIQSLQSQINPHFLYNTLEVFRSEALINNDPEAAEMAESLANYFRYNISRRSDVVSLGEELDNVNNYIRIQKKRFGPRVNYRVIYHTGEEEARKAQIPKLSIQPLVENAIYHGIEKKAKGGTVTVHVTVTGKRIIVQVSDDGVGMDPEMLERVNDHITKGISLHSEQRNKHGGIALVNVSKRIKMLYGEEYGLTYSSTKNIGTEAEVTIPYIAG